jgi:serine/threonine-protein kinase
VAFGRDLVAGERVGSFEIEELISRGGFASIYRARNSAIGRQAAVKVLHKYLCSSVAMLRRFQQEAQAVNLIKHPNIIDVFEFGELADHRPYFIMEWLEGKNLHDHLDAHGPFAEAEAVNLMEDLGAALAAAHAVGVIHRDLKASNVILVPAGQWFHVKLVDFGIAKLAGGAAPSEISALGMRLGTPWNMAPEQILGLPVDARADIYALGVLFHQVLTSKLPFTGKTPAEVEQHHLNDPPPHLVDVSAAIDALVQHCLEKERERRPQTMKEFLHALRRSVTGPRSRGRVASVPAVGLRIELQLEAGTHVDEAAIEMLEQAIIDSRRACGKAGLDIALDQASTLVAVTPLPGDPEQSRTLRWSVLRAAVGLALELGKRQPRLRAALNLHVAPVLTRGEGSDIDYLGGDLLGVGGWVVRDPDGGVVITKAVAEGIEERLISEPLAQDPGLLVVAAIRGAGSR